MKYIRLLPPIFIALLAYHTPALAHDDVLPPPTEVSTPSSHDDSADVGDTSTNLQKELAPPKQSDEVEVHSYVRERDKAKITEYSVRGKVFRIKVQPPGGLPAYYLEDSDGDGTFNKRLPGGYKRLNPPMWVIKQF
jgi:hypothetical protein